MIARLPSAAIIRVTLLIAAVVVGAAWLPTGRAAAQTSGSSGPPPIGSSAPGQMVYLRDCAVCHGADATGTKVAPSLQEAGAAAVDYWVSTGRMPLLSNGRNPASPYARTPPGQLLPDPDQTPHRHTPLYSPATIRALVDYVTSIAPGGPGIPTVVLRGADLAAGGEIFRLQCAACHSWDGTGGALYQREAPSLHAATPTQIAEAMRTGPDQMPAFGPAAVPPDQLDAVVAYVRYLDHPDDRGGSPLWYLGPVAEGAVAIIGGLGGLLIAIRWIGERG